MKIFLSITIFSLSSFFCFSQATGTASVFQLASISNTTYLIDTVGNTYNSWQCSANGASTAYLLKDGSIMRPYKVQNPSMNGGATGGGLQIIDWNNNVIWDYLWSSPNHQQHHECIPIEQPNGTYNALIIAWERFDAATVQQAGGVNAEMWPTEIIEIEPVGSSSGNIVWEWHAFDHICQDNDTSLNNYYSDCNQHPELFDIGLFTGGGGGGQGNGDWIHANGMDYSPFLDQIVFSSHFLHEIYIIDHSTTTAQAATHVGGNAGRGGDLLYRWGNPSNYGLNGIRELYTVHGANFIDEGYPGEGNLMCFDNQATSNGGSGDSRVIELQAPLNNYNYTYPWIQSPLWTYSDPGNFYANHLSGAFRTKKETTVATLGTSTYWREVDMQGNIVYEYNHVSGGGGPGGGNMAKTAIYELDYPGLIGVVTAVKNQDIQFELDIYPNPATDKINVLLPSSTTLPVEVTIYDILGKKVNTHTATKKSFSLEINSFEKGIYFVKAMTSDYNITKKLIVK
jgi:hypothetical protein